MTRRLLPIVLLGTAAACVTEVVQEQQPAVPPILRFHETSMVPASVYHGVNFFLEVDPQVDLTPEEIAWMEGERTLPPPSRVMVPELAGGRETYRYKTLHRIDFYNSLYHVGNARYPLKSRARLYVFKERAGDLSFTFREQPIVVPSRRPWIPSLYYFPEQEESTGGRRIVRDVLLVGAVRIETVPSQPDRFLVNGKPHFLDAGKALPLPEGAR